MRSKLFCFVLIFLSISASANYAVDNTQSNDLGNWLYGRLAFLIYGLSAGLASGILLARFRKSRSRRRRISSSGQPATNPLPADINIFELEQEIGRWKHRFEELSRRLAETEKIQKSGALEQQAPGKDALEGRREAAVVRERNEEPAARKLYYLQPTIDGWFRSKGSVEHAPDALYELTMEGNQEAGKAMIRFMDSPGNTSLAIQNEATWILVACERNNVLTAATTSIITDTPGIAVLKNGEWKIVQKAKISYK